MGSPVRDHAFCVPQVSLNSGLTPSDPDEVCVDVGPLLLAPGGFFGVSAATSILAGEGLLGRGAVPTEHPF